MLAGVLPATGTLPGSDVGGVPPLDALDMWPLVSGAVKKSPRTGFALSAHAIIVGNVKYINGSVHSHESWNGPICASLCSELTRDVHDDLRATLLKCFGGACLARQATRATRTRTARWASGRVRPLLPLPCRPRAPELS